MFNFWWIGARMSVPQAMIVAGRLSTPLHTMVPWPLLAFWWIGARMSAPQTMMAGRRCTVQCATGTELSWQTFSSTGAPIDLAADPLEPSLPFTNRLPPDVRLLRRMIGESGALIVLATKMVGKAAKAKAKAKEREKRRADAVAGPCTRSRARRR